MSELILREKKQFLNKKKKKGFTLVELIAVIAILAILAAIIVPNVTGYQAKSKISSVKANAKTVLNVINTAKATADDPSTIKTYTDAVSADSTLATNPAPKTNLQSATVDILQAIISSTTTKYTDPVASNFGSFADYDK